MNKYLRCYRDFSGGLSEVANDNMADNQLHAARNIIPGEGAGIARAFGTEQAFPQLPSNFPAESFIEYKPASSATQLLAVVRVAENAVSIYRLNAAGNAWLAVSGAQGLPPLLDWFITGGKLFWLDGSAFRCYDGSSAQLANISIDGSFMIAPGDVAGNALMAKIDSAIAVERRGQRWFFATPDNEIIFSNVGQAADFSLTNIININSGFEDNITALYEFAEGLLIFQRRDIYFLSGWDFADGTDIRLSRLNVSCGTTWPKTVRRMENVVIYLGSNGVYRLYLPQAAYMPAAENISEGKISLALVQDGDIAEAHAEVWDNAYFLSVRGVNTGSKRREYRFYPRHKAFFGPYTQEAQAYALHNNQLLLLAKNGFLLRYSKDSRHYIDTQSGGNVGIPIYAETKAFDVAGAFAQNVRLDKALFICAKNEGGTAPLYLGIKCDAMGREYAVNLTDINAAPDWGQNHPPVDMGQSGTMTKEILVRRPAKRVSFTLSGSGAEQALLVYGLGMVYKRRKVNGKRAGINRVLEQG